MKKIPLLILVVLVIPLAHAEQWKTYHSEHFTFYYQENHLTAEELAVIAENQEALFTMITELLHIEFSGKIDYYLYGSRLDYDSIPGAYCIGSEIRYLCIFCEDFCKNGLNDAHEMTHALANSIGFQHGLLAEGLAVYVEDYVVYGVNLHGVVNVLYQQGRVTPLQDLLDDFWCDILFNYDIAGSFATYLIEEYGIDKLMELYGLTMGYYEVEEVYGKSLQELEQEWLTFIQKAEVTQTERNTVKYRDGIKEGLAIYFELGFFSMEYATYPAKAENSICLFRAQSKQDFEKAFLHLSQFNQGMVAWKEAIETFEDAMEEEDYHIKVELFKKAASLYSVAGDEHMMAEAVKYAEAYGSLVDITEYVEEGNRELAEQELEKVKPLLGELEGESDISMVDQHIQALKDGEEPGFEAGILLIFVCVLIVKGVMNKLR